MRNEWRVDTCTVVSCIIHRKEVNGQASELRAEGEKIK